MSKFNLKNRINLQPVLGDSHADDYMEFERVAMTDAKKLAEITGNVDPKNIKDKEALEKADQAVDFIRNRFVSGMITDEVSGKQIAVDAEDFDNGNLPIEVINYCIRQLMGIKPEGFTTA